MKIRVKIPHDYALFSPTDAAAFIASLASAQVIKTSGWGQDEKLEVSKDPIEIAIVQDLDLVPPPAPLVELQTQLRASEARWLEYYNKSNQSEARVKELEAKLASLKGDVAEL